MGDDNNKSRKCICKKCMKVFEYNEAITWNKTNHPLLTDKACPYCGGRIQYLEVPKYMDKYLFVNDDPKFYEY